MKRIVSAGLAVLCTCIAAPAVADDAQDREAIRVEIEQLRESGRLSVGDVDIASGDLLAEIYERRNFSHARSGDVDQIDSLSEAIRATEADGLDPDDYHLVQLRRVRGMLADGRVLDTQERAVLDIALTDSLP